MAFKPKTNDSPAPAGFRRYVHKREGELTYAVGLIRRDYQHTTAEQLLNVIVELHRRGSRNQLFSLLDWLQEMNGVKFAPEPEERIE